MNRIKIVFCFLALAIAWSVVAEENDTTSVLQLSEIVVQGNSARDRIANVRLGAERLELSKLAEIPSFAGENDVIKSLSMLPGVRSEGEGGGGFEVRGGTASQNLVLLNGISLYNPAHVMGIFSTFNDNALGSATLYKGPFPAMFGDATSSVLETSLAPGDMEHYHASLTIGILAAKLKAEGPIIKDKLSFAVTARRSYVDMFLALVPKYRGTVMNFYDVTAKLRYRPSSRHLIDGSFFASRDNMAVSHLMGLYWGNIGASISWQARATDDVVFTTTASVTHFDPKMTMDIMDMDQTMLTYIRNYSINERMRWNIGECHGLELGFRSELLKVKSAEWIINNTRERDIRSLWENDVWVEYAGSVNDRVEVSAGARVELSSVLTGDAFHDFMYAGADPDDCESKTYIDLQPRLSFKYQVNHRHNIKVGVGSATQNLHAIRSSATSFPFDRYALTSSDVKPERAMQYGIGYSGMTESGSYDWSVEGYYRSLANVYDYKDGRNSFSDIALESIILGGKGRSIGMEFMLRKNFGKLTGWVAYTLSRTEIKIPGINDGKWYEASNDCRHDLSLSGIYKFSNKWSLSASWVYMSGKPLTAPDVKYEIAGETCYYYSRRNAYKTPSTHRLDISAKYIHSGKKFTYEWSFGIYNAYCRYNPYIVYFEDDPSKPSGTRAVLRAMYGLVPSVSYTLKF